MKKLIFMLILLTLSISCFSASVSGRVFTVNDPAGIQGIRVAYIGSVNFSISMLDSIYSNNFSIDDFILASDTTDQNGNYTIQIVPGTEGIIVAHDIMNFHFMEQFIDLNENYDDDIEDAGIFEFDEMDIHFDNFNFMLHPIDLNGDNTVAGSITPPSNAAGLSIDYDVRLEFIHSHILPPYTCTVNTANPTFAFTNIRDGQYRLRLFSRYNPRGSFYNHNNSPVYQRIIVRGGETIDTLNFNLPDIEYKTLNMTVNDDSSNPLPEAAINLVSLNSDLVYSITTNASGSAVISNLVPGRYTISVYKENYVRSDYSGNIVTINTDRNYTFEMSAVQISGNSISGSVSIRPDLPEPPPFPTMVIAVSSDDEDEWARTTNLGSGSGQFVLNDLPSDDYFIYVISSDAPPTFFPNSATWEDAQLVTASGDVDNINVVITPAANEGVFSVTGHVASQATRGPVTAASVILYNEDNTPVGFSISNENGDYNINHLRSGNYTRKVSKINYVSQCHPFQVFGSCSSDLTLASTSTSNDDINFKQSNISLSCYPNPFNPETTIEYSIDKDSNVELVIYNIKGQKVYSFNPEYQTKGIHKVKWSGVSDNKRPVASGVYFYQLKTETESRISKMLLLK